MQCTAQALNLACANRVIILDVWWNYAMEQQASGRVYRMGQTKETYFGRIMVRNTIDMRLYKLQLDKLQTIGRAIKEHDSGDLAITEEDVASLFGRVVHDDEGHIINIVADYEDESEHEAEEAALATHTLGGDSFPSEWEQQTVMGDAQDTTLEDTLDNTLNTFDTNFESNLADALTNFLEDPNESIQGNTHEGDLENY
jgi:hypothetical protein